MYKLKLKFKNMFSKENLKHAGTTIVTVIIAMAIYQRFISTHVGPKKPTVAVKA